MFQQGHSDGSTVEDVTEIDDPCSLTTQNCCRIARLSPIHGDVSFSIICFTISEVLVLNLSCCIAVFRLRIICLCKWMIQSGESDSTVYYSCDDRFSQGDNDIKTDQVLGNRQDFSSNEGTLDREGITHIVQFFFFFAKLISYILVVID